MLAVLRDILADPTVQRIVASALIVVGVVALRMVAMRAIDRADFTPDARLLWRAQVRNAMIAAVLLGVTIVWAEQLRTIAISVVAVAAAVVVATRELIACLLGALLRASGRTFRLGDRIEIGGVRGDVIDIGPMTTSLLEVGAGASVQGTGRVVTLPNSVLLTQNVYNETVSHEFVMHALRVPIAADKDWRAAEARLLEVAAEATREHLPQARAEMAREARDHGVTAPDVEASVHVELTETGRVDLVLWFVAPVRRRAALAQDILRGYLALAPNEA